MSILNTHVRALIAISFLLIIDSPLVNAQSFTPAELNQGTITSTAALVEDYDGDGDQDVVITRRTISFTDGLEWLENLGNGQFIRRPLYDD